MSGGSCSIRLRAFYGQPQSGEEKRRTRGEETACVRLRKALSSTERELCIERIRKNKWKERIDGSDFEATQRRGREKKKELGRTTTTKFKNTSRRISVLFKKGPRPASSETSISKKQWGMKKGGSRREDGQSSRRGCHLTKEKLLWE